VRKDSQDVGLEAAIIERVRNSSLVECARTDNVARLKHRTEAVECSSYPRSIGRGALCAAEKPDRKDGWSAHKSECRNE
jgi:hypothetical protein